MQSRAQLQCTKGNEYLGESMKKACEETQSFKYSLSSGTPGYQTSFLQPEMLIEYEKNCLSDNLAASENRGSINIFH